MNGRLLLLPILLAVVVGCVDDQDSRAEISNHGETDGSDKDTFLCLEGTGAVATSIKGDSGHIVVRVGIFKRGAETHNLLQKEYYPTFSTQEYSEPFSVPSEVENTEDYPAELRLDVDRVQSWHGRFTVTAAC